MALKDIFKISRKTFFYPTGWFGYNILASFSQTIWNIVRNLFVPAQPQRKETFEEAKLRLNLTEEDIRQTGRNYFIYSIIFVSLGILSFLASFYLVISFGTWSGWLLANAAAALFITNAFRFHFWYFQIKHRKLGCTFEEWWQGKPFETKEPLP